MAHMIIAPLLASDVALIKASTTVTSLGDAVVGLVKNSLDAGAGRVDVSIDYSSGSCSVEDDGAGIHADEFQETSGLLRRFCGFILLRPSHPEPLGNPLQTTSSLIAETIPGTSKRESVDVHGSSGTFLAALAAMSSFEITSSTEAGLSRCSIKGQYGAVHSRSSDCHGSYSSTGFEKGTKVTIRHLFGHIPVRIKLRALQRYNDGISREWQTLKHHLVALLLAWPTSIRLQVCVSSLNQDMLVRGVKSAELPPDRSTYLSWRISRNTSILIDAGMVKPTARASWSPVSASGPSILIRGAISLFPSASKRRQFISIGVHPVASDTRFQGLYDIVNHLFEASRFGEQTVLTNECDELLYREDLHRDLDPSKVRDIGGKEKGVDRWPIFILHIKFKREEGTSYDQKIDALFNHVVKLTEAMISQWLGIHGFAIPRKRSTLLMESPTTSLRADSSLSAIMTLPSKILSEGRILSKSQMSSMIANGGETSQISASLASSPDTMDREYSIVPRNSGSSRNYKGPASEHTISSLGSKAEVARSAANTISTTEPCRPRSFLSSARASTELSPWLKSMLSRWQNPVFELPDAAIARAAADHSANQHLSSQCCRSQETSSNALCISLHQLRHASVVAQVDEKFILIKTSSKTPAISRNGGDEMLVIIDQHAADERIRTEELLRDLCCRTSIVNLTDSICFDADGYEVTLLRSRSVQFEKWGISYEIQDLTPSKSRLNFRTLPASIAQRCMKEPRLLTEMIRDEVWRSEQDRIKTESTSNDSSLGSNLHYWVRQVAGCPAGIIDMINSRACRSAIMFNDKLEKNDCIQLLARLGECAFPFQCAHGRPSMIPLMQVDDFHTIDDWGSNFVCAYNRWRRRKE